MDRLLEYLHRTVISEITLQLHHIITINLSIVSQTTQLFLYTIGFFLTSTVTQCAN